jgi:tRNA modification GTPase
MVAAGHLKGALGRHIWESREALLDLLARVEAALDFPEDAGEPAPESLKAGIAHQVMELQDLAATYREGRLLREGLKVVIAGRPNAGKSSLLNRLLNLERAIVSEIPGTTRDFIEETVTLSGVPVRLMDTAGLRIAKDQVEEQGVRLTRERLAQADLALYLMDGGTPLTDADRLDLTELAGQAGVAVINKIDLPLEISETQLQAATLFPIVKISALTGEGIQNLQQQIIDLALGGGVRPEGEVITQARHHRHLQNALEYLNQALDLLGPDAPYELAALELSEAIRELGEITGEEVGDAVLDRIFGEFCLGK